MSQEPSRRAMSPSYQQYLLEENKIKSPGLKKQRTLSSFIQKQPRKPLSPAKRAQPLQESFELECRPSVGNVVREMTGGQATNVKVVIRVRPLNEREKMTGNKSCVQIEDFSKITVDRPLDQKVFTFDYVAPQEAEQEDVFTNVAQPITDSCLQGYNGTIFAYGMTGSGKTFTIQGPAFSAQPEPFDQASTNEFEQRGLMQRSFEHIFNCIELEKQRAEQQGNEVKYLIKTSYLEIYNEQVMDLLEPTQTNLPVREDIKTGVYVEGLQEESVGSVRELEKLIQRGASSRKTGATNMNEKSSRSHSVLTTTIESKTLTAQGVWQMRSSRFHIIDLAGSERNKQTNAEGQRLKEAGMINKSLSALGNVINSLVDKSEGKTRHVHYRDSKLTFLLRDSLGGNSKTVIIANITQSQGSVNETLSTLQFAQRAKLIKNKAVINEESSGTIEILKAEIRRLKQQMAEMQRQESPLKCSPKPADLCAHCSAQTQVTPFAEEQPEAQPDRLSQLENLLSACLDNLTSAQKQADLENTRKASLLKHKQQALDQREKACQRDKMIIKFRDQRIQTLEAQLKDSEHTQCQHANEELIDQLRKERDHYKDVCERNEQTLAAKLFAEKEQLSQKCAQLQAEVKQSPESLHAQVTRLLEMTDSLNLYLKEHCEQTQQKQLEKEILNLNKSLEEKNFQLLEFQNQLDKLRQTHAQELKEAAQSLQTLQEKSQEQQQLIRDSFARELNCLKESFQSDSESQQQKELSMLERHTELERQLFEAREALSAAEKKELEVRKECLTLQEQLTKNEACLGQQADEIESIKTQHQAELTVVQQRQKVAEDQANFSLQETQKELLAALADLEATQRQGQESEEALQRVSAENQSLEQQLCQLQEKADRASDTYRKAVQEHNAQVCSVKGELDRERLHAETLSSNIESLEASLTTLNSQLTKKQSALHEAEQALAALQSQIDQDSSDHLELKHHLLESKNRLQSEMERKDSEHREQIAEMTAKFDSLEQRLHELQSAQAEELNASQRRVEQLSTQLQQTASKLEESQQQTSEAERSAQHLTQRLEQLVAEYETLEKVSDEQKVELESAQSQLLKTKEAHQNALKEVSKLNRNEAELQSQLQKTRTDADLQSQKLVNQLKEKDLAAMQLQGQNLLQKTELQQQRQEFDSKLDQLQASITTQMQEERDLLQKQHSLIIEEREEQVRQTCVSQFGQELEQRVKKIREELQREKEAEVKQRVQQVDRVRLENEEKLRQEFAQRLQSEVAVAAHQSLERDTLHHKLQIKLETHQKQAQLLRTQLSDLKSALTTHSLQFRDLFTQTSNHLQRQAFAHHQNLLDTQEQLMEYKTLTAQLQQEKQQQLKVADQLSQALQQAEQALRQMHLQAQKPQAMGEAVKQELDKLRGEHNQLTADLAKARGQNAELQNKLQHAKHQTDSLIKQENQLMDELQKKIEELSQNQEKWRLKAEQYKRRNEELLQQSGGAKASAEVLELKSEVQKREHEIREIVRTLKRYNEDKKLLEAENQQLRTQLNQDASQGHQNLQQKIHHHEKIKIENNKLREEVYQLKEELRRAMNPDQQYQSQGSGVASPHQAQLLEQSKRDCLQMVEAMDALLSHALSAPGSSQLIAQMPKLKEALHKAQSQANDSRHAVLLQKQKAIVIQEVISNLGKLREQKVLSKQPSQAHRPSPSGLKDQQPPSASLNLQRQAKPEQQIYQASSFLQQLQK